MLFNSLIFMVFGPLVVMIWPGVRPHPRIRWCFLAATSLGFLAWCDPRLALLALACALFTYACGRAIASVNAQGLRALWLTLALATNLGGLALFRFPLLQNETLRLGFETPLALAAPFGILFLLMQNIAYSVDVYHARLKPVYALPHFLAFSLYFPSALTGPLARPRQLLQALEQPRPCGPDERWTSARQLILGYFLANAVAANLICSIADAYHAVKPATSPWYWWGIACAIALCAYALLHGHSLIARGYSGLLGISLPVHFRHPFVAGSHRGFWRRWCCSLHVWLRLYVAWPLRGFLPARLHQPFAIAAMGLLFGGAPHHLVLFALAAALAAVEGGFPVARFPRTLRVVYGVGATLTLIGLWLFFQTPELKRALELFAQLFVPAGQEPRNGFWWATFSSIPFLLAAMGYEAWGLRKHLPQAPQTVALARRWEPLLWAVLLVSALFMRGPAPDLAALLFNLMH